MTSSYTANSGIEKPDTGDQEGAWGGTLNTNFDIIDRVLSGVGSVSLSGTTHTLTTTDGTLTDGMYRVLLFTGALGANNTVTISPNDQDKLYFIVNNTTDSGSSGPYSVIIKQGTGDTVTVANGAFNMVYADGAGSGAAVISLLSKDVVFGDDVSLQSDSAVLGFGADNDVTVTHNADKGLTLNSMDISGVKSINGTDSGSGANYGQIGGRRNMVYNGDMQVCQRATSVTTIGDGNTGYIAQDRWKFYEAGSPAAEVTWSQSTTAPDGFHSSLKMIATTNSGTVGVDDLFTLSQLFEGQDLQGWNKGDAQARSVTLSFWVNATQTGTYCVNLIDNDNSRQISKSYTIDSSDTWEYKTLTFEGDTTGAFDNDTALSLYVYWGLVVGTNYTSGTLGTSWAAYDATTRFEPCDAFDDDDDMFHITGVQMELGDTETAFEYEGYGENLARCQRYYNKMVVADVGYYYAPAIHDGTYRRSSFNFPVTMRSETITTAQSGITGHTGTPSAIAYREGVQWQMNVSSSGNLSYFTTDGYITNDAEI